MSNTKSILRAAAIQPIDIPSEESIIAAGRELIESTDSWQLKKTINNVKVVHKPATSTDGSWFCRISEHSPEEVTYDQLWDKMARNKAQNEKDFIPELVKIKKLQEISPAAQIWNLYYKIPFPLSNRTFTALQVVDESASLIVSIPIDLSAHRELQKGEEAGVRALYVAVERIKQLDNGKVEWRMACSSVSDGWVPKFIEDLVMPKAIAADVPRFLKWFKSLPKSTS
ncbi:hypothetical protein Agabi119p4_2875 [Agaricus bisporus var. burnettii]|uniref:DUF3074 domain-containing protein n=1 Tax=Agaricus bisporus var. burnettii TaxID=192524 RepID=A0A8H7F6D8_AGABI|nr:hypothetical protein Agabi119p4_2875 [Agaricus bisporus var. burnettii]